jgi:DNA-binding NarL/FixJ family response regulator
VTVGLSERDRRMLELSAEGWTCEEIATELNVAARTVRRFLSSVRDQIRGENG